MNRFTGPIRNLSLVLVVAVFVIFLLHTHNPASIPESYFHVDRLTAQRDNLSRELNRLQERHQRLVCERDQTKTSETGEWCDVAVHTRHLTDHQLAASLADVFANRSVIGLGDGRGEYRKLILGTRKVFLYDAYDGAPGIRNITRGKVKYLDLSLPQYWLPRYDWVLSLEVLEHIPRQFETIAMDNIDCAAGHGVVLSWAVPEQPGFNHINRRTPSYVKQVMSDRGFEYNEDISLALRNIAIFPWLRKKCNGFYAQINPQKQRLQWLTAIVGT